MKNDDILREDNDYIESKEPPPLPGPHDKLFNEANVDVSYNAVLNSGHDKFFLYSDSYKTAAEKLYDQFDGTPFYANTLCYPIVFLSRHFLELRLKELIVNLNYAFDLDYPIKDDHSLISLWNKFKKMIDRQESYKVESKMLKNAERLINEFNVIDPKSFSFRYPVDNTPEMNPTLKTTVIDLNNFMQTMKKLIQFFDDESWHVSYFVDMVDEYKTIMYQEYVSSYY